ncbi:MAG: ComF family protein [Terriglobales bacterium]
MIHLLKFAGVRTIAPFWAHRLASLVSTLPAAPDLVVPVPLGKRRRRERGFNQSADIARFLAQRIPCAFVPRALERCRETEPQSNLPLDLREQNIDDAFSASPRQLAGKCVLLVDDVLTTGATARAAAHALGQAGAGRVMLAVAARADLRHRNAGKVAAA